MKRQRPLIDEKNYVVTISSGERRGSLTSEAALELARTRFAEWHALGIPVRVTVYFNPTGEKIEEFI